MTAGADRGVRGKRSRRWTPRALALAGTLTAGSCSPGFVGLTSPCTVAEGPVALPREVRESSGIVPAAGRADLLWTHNDSGGTNHIHAVDRSGSLVASIRVPGVNFRDFEEMASGPCPEGGTCLYLADVGDNQERRAAVTLHRIPEPATDAEETARPRSFTLRFPEGPRDVEAMYLLPGERLFLVSKGRNHPVEVYRVPPLDTPGEFLLLERVQALTGGTPFLPRWVTGAAATADGRFVAIRSYETLRFYRTHADGTLEEVAGGLVNLRPAREPQGEGVSFLSRGAAAPPLPGGPPPSEASSPSDAPAAFDLVLTSEAGPGGRVGTMTFLRCTGIR